METVAVIFGGRSAEHDVSIITAHIPIIDTLLASKQFEIVPIYIAKDGRWYSDSSMNDLSFFKKENYESELGKPIELSFDSGFSIRWPGFFGKSQKIDIVFPAMHGTYGEDGSLMGLLRMANVPFVGCDIFASAVAMDKVLTKQVLAAEGIPVVPYVWFTKEMWEKGASDLRAKIQKDLRWPLFVKPVHLGSSIGIGKASNAEELERTIEVALHYDDKVLVENGIEPLLEVTLPMMGNDEIRTAECERPLNKTEFLNFDDKYMHGGKKSEAVESVYSEIPAKITDEMTGAIKDLGTRVYRTLGCAGIARVDFLVHESTGAIYVNEVNTLPGSLYHHNWKKSGVSNMDLVLGLMELAKKRFNWQKKTTFTFQSDILKRVGGTKANV